MLFIIMEYVSGQVAVSFGPRHGRRSGGGRQARHRDMPWSRPRPRDTASSTATSNPPTSCSIWRAAPRSGISAWPATPDKWCRKERKYSAHPTTPRRKSSTRPKASIIVPIFSRWECSCTSCSPDDLPADDPRPPSAIAHVSPRFDAIVRRATDVQPERRYSSALEIAHDLQAISTTPGTQGPSHQHSPQSPANPASTSQNARFGSQPILQGWHDCPALDRHRRGGPPLPPPFKRSSRSRKMVPPEPRS